MTDELTDQLALAGLIHDIGKFMLRAAVSGNFTWDMETQGDFGYRHAMLSAAFAEQYIPEPWRSRVKNMAGNHHRPQSREDLIVSLADMLSAGEGNDGTEDEDPRVQHRRQLLSIFSVLEADRIGQSETERRYLPLRPLAVERNVLFPQKEAEEEESWHAYAKLWESFERDLQRLKAAHDADPDLPSYLESLLLLMQRYLWCVPSACYRNLPDISLYDHGRTTAALAAVLNRAEVDDVTLTRWRSNPQAVDDNLALLVGGDISGVQDFIYTITARGATPTLRGRSFYLQMLTDALARFLLRRLELPVTNLIYAGGGSFFLLARPGDAKRLPGIQREISRILLQQHGGELYAALADVPVAGRKFFGDSMSRKWDDLHEALRRKKLRRFAELDDELAALFEPIGHGGNEDRQCQVCGQEHAETKPEGEPGAESIRKCPSCLAFEKLGDDLRNARYLVLEETELTDSQPFDPERPAGTWRETLERLGLRIAICENAPQQNSETRRHVFALDDKTASGLHPLSRVVVGRRFLVNLVPTLTEADRSELRQIMTPAEWEELPPAGKVKSFSALENQSTGIKRLGILRMDVDNLGQLFQNGFGQRATLSRIAALSFAVSLYFDGWVSQVVNEVNRTDEQGRDRIYTIYSGGDDLFFVGSWDAMIELAVRIRADLTAYAARHPGIHASAGVVLVGGKYPLSQAAQDAAGAEEAAKNLVWWNGDIKKQKDAISFLGTPLPWRTFGLETDRAGNLETAHGLMHTLVKLCSDENRDTAAPRAFVRALTDIHRQYADAQEKWRKDQADSEWRDRDQVLLGPWAWRAAYALNRAKVDGAKEIEDMLCSSDYRMMEWLGVAAGWADLYIRR
ncbi:MAG: type III-A CRISPR-associated protein Cas10/Csm1 [Caldilineaceae bacterium SB0661_bin_32]|uniref:CRISPR system single-strand-specific deoxyribonuclease Cas10/Csm1 (subtype III-A) n=1 Tax=Caldilineaceae bacterium SB0661_bin_32 TaxID=2605255 RepID=A0A6B1D947_9CHLR|nr:type III-A CRISPR-associated protein Cas10/Csm1 [Caldilineaceae bacterium SB0661_bin_32]